jgi:hypothetical protein
VDSGSNPPPREIKVGGRSLLHYPASDPCDSSTLRETSGDQPWFFALIVLVLLVGCLIAIRTQRRALRDAANDKRAV